MLSPVTTHLDVASTVTFAYPFPPSPAFDSSSTIAPMSVLLSVMFSSSVLMLSQRISPVICCPIAVNTQFAPLPPACPQPRLLLLPVHFRKKSGVPAVLISTDRSVKELEVLVV